MQKFKRLIMLFACTALVLGSALLVGAVDASAAEIPEGGIEAAQLELGDPGSGDIAGEPVVPADFVPAAFTGDGADPGFVEEGGEVVPLSDPVPEPAAAAEATPPEPAEPVDLVPQAAEPETPAYTWWQWIDGNLYFYETDGTLQTGVFEVNGAQYYADGAGVVQSGFFWDWEAGGTRYADPNTLQLQNWWQNIEGGAYFFGEDYLSRKGVQEIGGASYYLEDNGRARVGLFEDAAANTNRYADPNTLQLQSWWQNINGDVYFFGEDYLARKGYQQVGGASYYLEDSGKARTGFFWDWPAGGTRYVDANTLQLQSWWQNIEGGTYFFGDDYVSRSGFQKIGDNAYFLEDNGKARTGLFWDWPAGSIRYADANTLQLQKGWTVVDTHEYYFDPATYLAARGTQNVDGAVREFTDNGIARKGLVVSTNGTYYYDRGISSGNWFMNFDGTVYFFAAPGAKASTGFFQVGQAAYFGDDTGALKTGAFWDWPAGSVRYGDPNTLQLIRGWMDMGHNGSYYFDTYFLAMQGPQVIDGTTYYFDPATCLTMDRIKYMVQRGIDISSHQGPIDWAAVKASGAVDFAIIRALTWSGNYYAIDPYFEHNVREAKRNGIMVGAYLFTYAFNNAEMAEEVNFFHNSSEMARLRSEGIVFDLPVFIDFEWNTALERTTYDSRTEMLGYGMNMLNQYGYAPGFYSSLSWARNHYNAAALENQGYTFWLANYKNPNTPDRSPDEDNGWKSAPIWQYSSTGRVAGINGNVDMNFSYRHYNYIPAGGIGEDRITVYDLNTGTTVTDTVSSILARIVENEVGGINNEEVYKAQTVAAYSWLLNHNANYNSLPKVGLRTPRAAVQSAVSQVSGQYMAYGGQPILAMYGASTAGVTNNAQTYFASNAYPYLATVSDPGGVTHANQVTSYNTTQMSEAVRKITGAAPTGDPSGWLKLSGVGGYITGANVNGKSVTASTFYDNSWGVYSPYVQSFTYNSNQTWTFVTSGNGHGIGMSQTGAGYYAKNHGWNYRMILEHYYPGTQFV